MSRVIVIGAGVGGLAAAARLATQGHRVTVCEQAPVIGGKLGRLRQDGFVFDTGPSLVTMPQVFEEFFSGTGDPMRSVLKLERTTLPRARFPGTGPMEAATTAEEFLEGLDISQRAQWQNLMKRAERIWEATSESFLTSPIGTPRALVRLLGRQTRDLRTVAPWKTLRDLSDELLTDPHLKFLLDRYATYSGSDPRKAPAALAVVPFVEQRFGAWYVPGGLYLLGEAIRDRALERGATVRTDTEVSRIITSGKRVTGVELADGTHLDADAVVANVDAAHLYTDLLPRPRLAGRVEKRASYGGFAVMLGVRGSYHRLAHHEILFPENYETEFDELGEGTPLTDPTIYVSRPLDAAVAPSGHEAWFVLVNAPRQGQVEWDELTPSYSVKILDLLAERGLDIRDRITTQATRSPRDLERQTRAVGGAIYGSSSDGARSAFLRPANDGPVRGLFLVGGSAHPGGGLPLGTLSARIVAGLVGTA